MPIEYILSELLSALVRKFIDIISAPAQFPEMIWILIPLVASVIFIELYFGRYEHESIGYHGAVENSIFLFFVAVDLIRYQLFVSHEYHGPKLFVVGVIIAYAGAMSLLNFFHIVPMNIAFKIFNKFKVGFIAYIGIIVVYSDILNDASLFNIIVTAIDIAVLFIICRMILSSLETLEPKSHDKAEEILSNFEKDVEKVAKSIKK